MNSAGLRCGEALTIGIWAERQLGPTNLEASPEIAEPEAK